jgi:hypothetical protein
VWENSPKRGTVPFVDTDIQKQFGINLKNGTTVYYEVKYKARKDSDGKNYIDIDLISSSKETAYTTTEPTVYAPHYRLEPILMAEDKTLEYDHTFPSISEEEKGNYSNRQNAFFKKKENKDAKYA